MGEHKRFAPLLIFESPGLKTVCVKVLLFYEHMADYFLAYCRGSALFPWTLLRLEIIKINYIILADVFLIIHHRCSDPTLTRETEILFCTKLFFCSSPGIFVTTVNTFKYNYLTFFLDFFSPFFENNYKKI